MQRILSCLLSRTPNAHYMSQIICLETCVVLICSYLIGCFEDKVLIAVNWRKGENDQGDDIFV